MRLCICCVLLCLIPTRAAGQGPTRTAAQLQELLQKGGQHWSVPNKARSIFGSVSAGDRFWIWPLEDRVLEMRRRTPTITLAWQLRPEQRAIDQAEQENLRLRFRTASGNFWTGGTASTFAKALRGIESGLASGTFEVPLGEDAGQGPVLVFLEAGNARQIEAVSNLLRIEVKIVDGESDYTPPPPEARINGWSTQRLATRSRAVSDFSFSPDGKTLASAGSDGAILLWDLLTGVAAPLASKAHRGDDARIEYSPDGSSLASWSRSDARVKLWDVGTRRAIAEIPVGSGRTMDALAFVPSSTIVACLTAKLKRHMPGVTFREANTAEVMFWDFAARKPIGTIRAETYKLSIDHMAFSPDGRVMVTWVGSVITLWDLSKFAPLGSALPDHAGGVATVAFSSDGKRLAVLHRAGALTRWNLEDLTRMSQSDLPNDRELTFVNFGVDGRTLALGGADRAVVLWDVTGHKPAAAPLADHPDGVAKGVISADGLKLASGTARQVVIWELPAGRVVARCLTDGPSLSPDRWSLTISADGTSVAVARQDSGIVTLCRAGGD
jgi:WD40 repeat protein